MNVIAPECYIAISVLLPGINPNCKSCNSCVLLSSRTYISKNLDKFVDTTIGLFWYRSMCHIQLSLVCGFERPLVKLSGTTPN